MVTATPSKGTRTFQKRETASEQSDIWYSPIPLLVMWAIYARQSTPAQLINNAESTEMQTDDLEQWLLDRGVPDGNWKLFDADLGKSGTLRIDQRTGLQELVELIKADVIKAVLVYQISRLFRDDTGVQYNTFATICKEHNCVLVTSDGMVFDFNNRMHWKMFRFLAEWAAEYIPQQIGLLHAARMRKAMRGLYAGLGSVARGYIVDYDKTSKTFKKPIPYKLHSEKVLSLFELYYALDGDFASFCREVEQMPYVFKNFEPGVDSRNIRDKKWKKVPGGYHISRRGLIWLLTNPFYIGWLIINGNIVSTNNHEAIIPVDKQYLFWFAFERLSPFTTAGEVNEERIVEPRSFYQRGTSEHVGLLKKRIYAPDGRQIRVHLSEGVHTYTTPRAEYKVDYATDSEIEVNLVDPEFTAMLFSHLRETHDFDVFREWIKEVIQREESLVDTINTQLEQIDRQQESILDDKLSIRTHINKQVREALAIDPTLEAETLKAQFEEEAGAELERLRKRSAKLDAMEKELRAKLPTEEEDQETRTARTFADFQTELEILAQVWDNKPFKDKKDFVNLLLDRAILSVASPHWIRLDIHWRHPAWAADSLFIYRRRGERVAWVEEEREILRSLYQTAERETLLSLMPRKSWNAIKKEARLLELRRTPRASLDIDEYTTWEDMQFLTQKGKEVNTRNTIYERLS